MSEHPNLHAEHTVCVERQKRFGRIDFSPCNPLASKFLEGLDQKSFTMDELKWIKSLGYSVLVIGSETEEL